MSPQIHKLYLFTLTSIVILVTLYLIINGADYYNTKLEERFYHPHHNDLKPSGLYGHGLGIIGTLLILIGVFGYMARKRFKVLSRIGVLKHWLEFHIFLCTLGPIMVLFHTAFKFGGIVSISFWSMVAVVLSGVIGRFIYLQIPRTIQGRALDINEIQNMRALAIEHIQAVHYELPIQARLLLENKEEVVPDNWLAHYIKDKSDVRQLHKILKNSNVPKSNISAVIHSFNEEKTLKRKVSRLQTMQKLFRYWHIAHLPFALIMLIIMIIHVAVTLTMGYKWIF